MQSEEKTKRFRRLWLDFRSGHTIYLVFAMALANFVTIQYKLVVEQIPTLKSFIDSIWVFAILFLVTYVPIAIVIGYWHRKKQLKVEAEALFYENPFAASLWLFLIKLIDGKATDEDKKKFVDMLTKISTGVKDSVQDKSMFTADSVNSKTSP